MPGLINRLFHRHARREHEAQQHTPPPPPPPQPIVTPIPPVPPVVVPVNPPPARITEKDSRFANRATNPLPSKKPSIISSTIPSTTAGPPRIGVELATKVEIECEDPLEPSEIEYDSLLPPDPFNFQTKTLHISDSRDLDDRIPNYTEKEPFPFADSLRPDPGGTQNKLSLETAATNVNSSTTTSALLTSTPSIASPTPNPSPDNMGVRILQPIVIIIDWICFCWVVRRAGFGVFIRSLMQLARDHGYYRVIKIILVLEEGNTHLSPELSEDVFTYAIDKHTIQVGYMSPPKYPCHCSQQFTSRRELLAHERIHPTRQPLPPSPTITRSTVESKDSGCTIPYILERESKSLYEATRMEAFRTHRGLFVLASSRPYIFDQHIYAWMDNDHRVLLVHGHGKIPHSLPSTTPQPNRRPPLKDLLKQTQATVSLLHTDPSEANSLQVHTLPSYQQLLDAQSFIRSIFSFTSMLAKDPSMPIWRHKDDDDLSDIDDNLSALSSIETSDSDLSMPNRVQKARIAETRTEMQASIGGHIPALPTDSVPSRQQLIDTDIDHLTLNFSTRLLGCYCIWTAPIWFEHFEKNIPTDSLPAQSVCPYYNAGLTCPPELVVQGKCKHNHLCQACAGEHTLDQCPVNLFTKNPLFDLALTSGWIPPIFDWSSLVLWYYERWQHLLQRQVSQFGGDRWKMSLKQQDTICHHINTPSGLVEYLPGPDGKYQLDEKTKQTKFPPCRAIILIDWQNIHVTIRFIDDFLNAIKSFVLNRPGLTENAIRVCYIFLDDTKQADAVKALREYEKKNPLFPLKIESILANKKQMIDSEIQSKLRTAPKYLQLATVHSHGVLIEAKIIQQPELVCMVSGDMDFSREMTRLVMLGHRVLLINNSQARYGFRVNPLWEESIDFITLPELQAYKALLQQKRDEKRSAAKSALTQGVGIKVGTVRLDDNTKLEQRIEQISGLAMQKKEHALLIADSGSGQLFRLKLPELSREKDARGKLLPIPSNDLLRGSLTILAGSNKKSLINANNRLLTGPALSVRFDDLREVVLHTRTNDIFLCDYDQNRIVCLPASSPEIFAMPHDTPSSNPITHPRYLCIDSQLDRLWVSDVSKDQYRLGFYDLQSEQARSHPYHLHHPDQDIRRRPHEPYRFIEVSAQTLLAIQRDDSAASGSLVRSRPSGKCMAADGLHLIYFDEAASAFCKLTTILEPPISFKVEKIHSLSDSNVPIVVQHEVQHVRVPSIQLDVDGSYLFTDTWTHTLKRLVYLPQVSTKESTTAARWEIKIVAGTGSASYIDGPANEAKFDLPTHLALDSEHHMVFISEDGNKLLRALYVDESQLMASGISSSSVKSGSSRSSSSSTKSTSSSSSSTSSDFVWKSSPCVSYESGTCHLQAEHHKCAFQHECSKCGGPHSAKDCLDLFTFIHQQPTPKEASSDTMQTKWIRQLIYGVQLLHRQKVPHLSLSSHNLLLDSEFNLTICDPRLCAGRRQLPKPFGSLPWTAPELIDTNTQSLSADMWSIGWLMIEIFTGEVPFAKLKSPELIKSTLQQLQTNPTNSALKSFVPELPVCAAPWKHLIDDCLQLDPSKRPTINILREFGCGSGTSDLQTGVLTILSVAASNTTLLSTAPFLAPAVVATVTFAAGLAAVRWFRGKRREQETKKPADHENQPPSNKQFEIPSQANKTTTTDPLSNSCAPSDIESALNDISEDDISFLSETNWNEASSSEIEEAKIVLEKKLVSELEWQLKELQDQFEEKQRQFEATTRTEKEIELNRMRQEMQAEFDAQRQRYEEEIKQRYQLQLEEQTKQIRIEAAKAVTQMQQAWNVINPVPIASPSISLPPTPSIIAQPASSSLPSITSTTAASPAAAQICSFWNKGYCKYGSACPFQHICHYADRHPDSVPKDAHLAGACPYKGNQSLSGVGGRAGNEEFICHVCHDKVFNSAAQLLQHEQGRSHQLRLQQQHQQPPPYPGITTSNPPTHDSLAQSTSHPKISIRPLHAIQPLELPHTQSQSQPMTVTSVPIIQSTHFERDSNEMESRSELEADYQECSACHCREKFMSELSTCGHRLCQGCLDLSLNDRRVIMCPVSGCHITHDPSECGSQWDAASTQYADSRPSSPHLLF